MRQFSFDPFPVLATQRLLLRKLTDEDTQFISMLCSDERVNEFIDRPKSTTPVQATIFIKNINKSIGENKSLYWIIVVKNENEPAGTIMLWHFSTEENCAELGYELYPQYQGKGIMQEAVNAVIAYVFDTIRLKKLYAWAHRNNTGSLKLLEKNNFTRDVQAEKLHEGNDELKNMLIYSLSVLND